MLKKFSFTKTLQPLRNFMNKFMILPALFLTAQLTCEECAQILPAIEQQETSIATSNVQTICEKYVAPEFNFDVIIELHTATESWKAFVQEHKNLILEAKNNTNCSPRDLVNTLSSFIFDPISASTGNLNLALHDDAAVNTLQSNAALYFLLRVKITKTEQYDHEFWQKLQEYMYNRQHMCQEAINTAGEANQPYVLMEEISDIFLDLEDIANMVAKENFGVNMTCELVTNADLA